METAIVYDPGLRLVAMVLEGEVIGFARTAHDADLTLRAVVDECQSILACPPSVLSECDDTVPTMTMEVADGTTNHTP
jgi:hypothetical protein